MAENGRVSLTAQQEKFLTELLSARSIAAAVAACGLADRTARRWLAQPVFRAALREARREALAAATGALVASAGSVVETLRSLAADEKTPAAVRVSAARTLLEYSFRAQEMDDLTARLEGVESTLAVLAEGR